MTNLSRCVAKLKGERLIIHIDHSVVGVHGRGHILIGVAVCRVGDYQGGFAHSSVPDKNAFDLVVAAQREIYLPGTTVSAGWGLALIYSNQSIDLELGASTYESNPAKKSINHALITN
jgi:hypothetical protein